MISNASPLAPYTILVYNTSVAASEQVADYYCQLRGIPKANKIGFAMGTVGVWAWQADWFTSVISPLGDLITSVGAKTVLAVAGCPHGVAVTDLNGTTTTVSMPDFLSAAKALYCSHAEPVASSTPVGQSVKSAANPTGPIIVRAAASPYLPNAYDAIADTAYQIGEELEQPALASTWLADISPTWQGEWESHAYLLSGVVGYAMYPDNSHPGDLYTRSKDILDGAVANEFPLEIARQKKVLIGQMYSHSGASGVAFDAHTVALLRTAGFTNVVHWNEIGLGKVQADSMAPTPATFGGATTADAKARITAGTAPTQDPWLLFGIGFSNEYYADANWIAFVGASGKGVSFVGASSGYYWARMLQSNGGIGGAGSPGAYAHIGESYIIRSASICNALLKGFSLCEAHLAQWNDYSAGHVIGDPLMRPILVTRPVAASAVVSGALPTGVSFSPITGALPSVSQLSNQIDLSGFSGPVVLTAGAGKGPVTMIVDGVTLLNATHILVSGPCSVQLRYVPRPVSSEVAVVELRGNGVLMASWSVTNAAFSAIPDPFDFEDTTGTELSSPQQSETITISGIDVSVMSYFTTTGSTVGAGQTKNLGLPSQFGPTVGGMSISNGDTITLFHNSAATYDTPTSSTATVNGVAGVFTSRTKAAT